MSKRSQVRYMGTVARGEEHGHGEDGALWRWSMMKMYECWSRRTLIHELRRLLLIWSSDWADDGSPIENENILILTLLDTCRYITCSPSPRNNSAPPATQIGNRIIDPVPCCFHVLQKKDKFETCLNADLIWKMGRGIPVFPRSQTASSLRDQHYDDDGNNQEYVDGSSRSNSSSVSSVIHGRWRRYCFSTRDITGGRGVPPPCSRIWLRNGWGWPSLSLFRVWEWQKTVIPKVIFTKRLS